MKVKTKTPIKFEELIAGNEVKDILLFVFLLFFAILSTSSNEFQHSQIIVPTKISQSEADYLYQVETTNLGSLKLNMIRE